MSAETVRCWHHGDERVTGSTYMRCFECGHVYETTHDLTNAYMDETGFAFREADDIPACPLCLHDF